MARFQSARFTGPGGREYEIVLTIDAIAALRDSMAIGVTVRRLPQGEEPGVDINATVTVRTQDEWGRAVADIEVEGERIGSIDLGNQRVPHADEQDAPANPESDPQDAWVVLRDFLLPGFGPDDPAAKAESLIEAIPALDPVLGCLLKGALSATVGQLLRCYQTVEPAQGGSARLRETARCLARNAGGVFGRAIYRSARCFVTLGYG